MSILMLATLACQPPIAPTAAPDTGIALTLTSVIQTLTAHSISTPAGVPSATPPEATIPAATDTPPTIAATTTLIPDTPTDTPVPSPSVPMVSVTTGTNCRSGPGRVYEILDVADVGIKFVVIGKSTSTNYWIIKLPDGRECWLWGQYAVPEGNLSALPEYAIPPTPRPPVGSVRGVITNNLGNPLSNVKVTAQLAGRTTTTGGNGRYAFDDLATGPEFITVESSAYNAEFRSVNVVQGRAAAADFILVKFVPGGGLATVRGRVLLDSTPAAGANVWIWPLDERTKTNNNGRYRFDVLSGKFLIIAQLGDRRGAVEVSLPRDKTTTAPDIILLPR